MANKNDWVQVHRIVLRPEQRAANIPEDTHRVPLEMWCKGRLTADANIGDEVEIITRTGRREHGTLTVVNPSYSHTFGEFIPELLVVDETVRGIVFGEEAN